MTALTGALISTSRERFPEMRRFYVEILGLDPRSDRPGFVNFDLAPGRLTVAVHSQVAGTATEPARIMINLAVGDVESTHARLTRDGVKFIRRPEREKWGGIVATLVDPDGNYLQLLQLPEE